MFYPPKQRSQVNPHTSTLSVYRRLVARIAELADSNATKADYIEARDRMETENPWLGKEEARQWQLQSPAHTTA